MFVTVPWLDLALRAGLLSVIGLAWVVIVVRIIGLRAFSKMTAFDFVVTVAIGSLLAGASQATDWAGFAQPTLAIAALLAGQTAIALARSRSDAVKHALHNTPVLLMYDGVMDDAALAQTRTDRSDVIAKLREANVLSLDDVRAVVLETTGDISVLHGTKLDDTLMTGVRQMR